MRGCSSPDAARSGKNAVTNALEILNGFYNPSFVQLKQAPAAEGYERFSAANAGSDGKTVRKGGAGSSVEFLG